MLNNATLNSTNILKSIDLDRAVRDHVKNSFFIKMYGCIGKNSKMAADLALKLGSSQNMENIIIYFYLTEKYKTDVLLSLIKEIKSIYQEDDAAFVKERLESYDWCIGTDGMPIWFLTKLSNGIKAYLQNYTVQEFLELLKQERDDYFEFEHYRTVVPLSNIILYTIKEQCKLVSGKES